MWGLSGQGVEPFGRSEALFCGLHDQLSFLDHVHEFAPAQGVVSSVERFKPQHRPCYPLYSSLVLFRHIIYLLTLADGDRRAVRLVIALDGRFIGRAPGDGDLLRHTVPADRLDEEALGGGRLALLCQQEIARLSRLIHRPIQRVPLPFDLEVRLVHAPTHPHRALAPVDGLFQPRAVCNHSPVDGGVSHGDPTFEHEFFDLARTEGRGHVPAAATLAIVFYPVCQWVQSRLGTRASVAALLTLGVILVAVILPLSLIGVAVVQEAAALYKRLETGDLTMQEPLQMLERLLSVLTQYLNRLGIETQNLTQSLAGATVTVSRFVGTQALNLGQDTLRLSVMFALMLYLLFFFLRDGPQIVTAILYALPLGNTRARRLFAHFATVSRATLKGTVVVALVQGLVGGILFAIVGINAAVLWGALMAVLSLLPALGSALIWIPAAGTLLVTGYIAKACIVLGAGVLVIGLIDNLLRPLLIGQDTRMPDYLVLVSCVVPVSLRDMCSFLSLQCLQTPHVTWRHR